MGNCAGDPDPVRHGWRSRGVGVDLVVSAHVLQSLARWPLGLLVLSGALGCDIPDEALGVGHHEISPRLAG